MRVTVLGVFCFALASLAQAQISSIGPGQISCEQFSARRNVLLRNYVPAALEQAMPGKKELAGGSLIDAQPPDWPALKMLGDGVSIGVLKSVSSKDLTKPEFVKAYLQVIRIVFSEPQWTVCVEDKTPEITIFLLDYMREKVGDTALQRQIGSTREFVLKQAPLTNGHGN
jgi:hypothetical protein